MVIPEVTTIEVLVDERSVTVAETVHPPLVVTFRKEVVESTARPNASLSQNPR